MPDIPESDKEIGDAGHTDDHNLITLALVNHEGRLSLAESEVAEMLTSTESYDVHLNNTDHTYLFRVVLPEGDRSGQPDILSIVRNGTAVLNADGDGRLHLRSGSSSSVSIPLVVRANMSQSANLTEWRNGAGVVITRVDNAGHIYAPNLNVNGPHNVALSSGMSWVNNPSPALRPRYYTQGMFTDLRGAVTPSTGSFGFGSGSIQLGSIPQEVAPPYGHMAVVAASGDMSGTRWVNLQVTTPSLGASAIIAHAPGDYSPNIIYLDNVRFYRGV